MSAFFKPYDSAVSRSARALCAFIAVRSDAGAKTRGGLESLRRNSIRIATASDLQISSWKLASASTLLARWRSLHDLGDNSEGLVLTQTNERRQFPFVADFLPYNVMLTKVG